MRSFLREAVAEGARDLATMTPGRTGNLSVLSEQEVAITPTGVPYDEIEPGDVPVLAMDGAQVAGDMEPSSEVPMHLELYRSIDLQALVHTHSPWSTTLGVLNESLPPVHYMVALAGGEVPVAEYAPYGTEELAENVVDAMDRADTSAAILANHGLVAGGSDVAEALETAEAVESTARLYLQARAVGEPVELSEDQISAVSRRFDSYGQD